MTLPPAAVRELVALAAERRYSTMEVMAAALTEGYPNSGLAWKALGVARQLQEKDALAAFQRAAELLPQDAESQSNLGSALRRIGRPREAVACYGKALNIRPDSAEVWNNLGNAQRDLGHHEEAHGAFQRALELQPRFAKACNNLGNVLLDLGRPDDAVAFYRRASVLDPGYAEAFYNLGCALRAQMRTAEAEDSCQKALEIDPNYAAAIILSAELHSDRGAFDTAEACFRRASAIEPDSPEAWAGAAGLRRMNAGDADWLNGAQRIAGLPLAPRRELHLRYAMGKYFDDVGDYAKAFANYHRANELTKIVRPAHNRRRVSEGVDELIRLYNEEWIARVRLDTNEYERPVFIVGMPRSGTTLAEQILASQGSVFGAGELPFWNTAAARFAVAREKAENERAILAILADDYRRQLDTLSGNACRVVDKMPGNFWYLGLLVAALPKARIIHLQRNPIDTCLSIYFQNFSAAHSYSNDLEDLAQYYSEYQRIMDHWRRVLPPQVLLEVSYEELVGEAESASRRMLEFIGLPWNPECLEFHRRVRPMSTFSRWQARQKITQASIARWRHYEPFVASLRHLA